MVYDSERIRIIDMIPKIIEHYEVEGTLREDLMNFRKYPGQDHRGTCARKITTLQKYKPYDFRIGVSYAAMMTIMQRKEEVIRNRMLKDHKDPETMLGRALPAPEGNLPLGPGSARAAGTSLSG